MLDLDGVASAVKDPTMIRVTLSCVWVLSERALWLLLNDGRRHDRILGFFLSPEIGQFSPGWGDFLTKLNSKPGEKKKSTGENIKKETALQNGKFLSSVMVERVLSIVWCTKPWL